jgi:hypothetical protein
MGHWDFSTSSMLEGFVHRQKEVLEINIQLERLAATHHQREIGSISFQGEGFC